MYIYFLLIIYNQKVLSTGLFMFLISCTFFVFLDAKSVNGFIGLFILIVATFFQFRKFRTTIILTFPLALASFIVTVSERLSNLLSDPSLVGRLVAFKELTSTAHNVGFWGTGFTFNSDTEVVSSGAALGSKAFSLPFQIFWIGGYPLLILVMLFLIFVLLRDLHKKQFIQIGILVSFLCMSTFAPLAQGIVGMYFILLRLNSTMK